MEDDNIQAPLARFHGAEPPAPTWFREAVAQAPERLWTEVDGARIETLVWGERGKPGLLLLHGNGAHADWWSFIAPFFAADYHVVAFSWSGMGRSDWRERYTSQSFVKEIFAVAEATGLYEAAVKPLIVGHSFGGFILSAATAWQGKRIGGAVVVDSPIRPPDLGRAFREEHAPRLIGRPSHLYPSLEAALARFRFAPVQPCVNLFIADHIARHSLKSVPRDDGDGEGWTWRFDPWRFQNMTIEMAAPLLQAATCPVALIWGECSSLMPPEVVSYMRGLMDADAPVIGIPDADHHVMVDQPLAFVTALRGLLVGWPNK